MARRHTFTKALGAVMAGALLLAACGGGASDSRTRNAAIGTLEQSDCWATQQAKDEFLTTLGAQVEQATQAAADLAVAQEAYLDDGKKATSAYEAWMAIDFILGDPLESEYAAAKAKAAESHAAWRALQQQVERLPGLNDQIERESNKPLCGEQATTQETTQDTTEAPTTSQGGDLVAAGLDECQIPEAYVMKNKLEVGETTAVGILKCGNLQGILGFPAGLSAVPGQTDTEFVWTLTAVSPGSHTIEMFHLDPQTSETSVKQPFTIAVAGEPTETTALPPTTSVVSPPTTSTIEDATCGLPVPREGRDFLVDQGEALEFTFDLCESWTGLGVQSQNWPDTVIEQYSLEGRVVVITIQFPNAGTARLGFLGYNQQTNQLVTEPLMVTVTVRESSANDPCAGKAPEGSWDPDFEGGSFVGTSTCEGITTLKVVVDRVVDDERTEVFNGYMGSGLPHTDLIQLFGEGTYRVYLRHVSRPSIDDEWTTLGDAGWLDVTYTPPRGGRVSNGAALLPTVAFEPSVTESPANPRDASPSVPVVAVPIDAPVLTCDQACIDSLLTRVGAKSGTVDIAFGAADFERVTAGGSFVAPLSATSVRVRVTPTDGEPVTMAAVFTRDTVDEAYAEVSMEEVNTNVTSVVGDDGSSFPWWLVVLIAVLIVVLGGVLARRRFTERTAS